MASTTFSSSTSSTLTSSTLASSSTSSSSSDNNGGIPSKGANYFFGFLITFIVLLSFFICCGFSTRRRFIRRTFFVWGQWDSDLDMDGDGHMMNDGDIPTMFEPRFSKHDHDRNMYSTWLSIQPLTVQEVMSASPLTNDRLQPSLVPPPPPIRSASRNPHALHGLSLPSWIPAPSLNASGSGSNDEKRNGKEPAIPSECVTTAVQVAVMIAMPCQPMKVEREERDGCPRYLEIGVASESSPGDIRRTPEVDSS
ncbi:hypothetical protein FB446DRAFT_716301 [Lentinula raphanica]|nr:hypothetical protein FB446DRAFT_716301 [Lentinula raphanica]